VNVAGFKMLVEQILPAWKRSSKSAAVHWPAKTAEFLENVMLQMKAKNIASAVDHHVETPGAAALILSDAAPIRYTSPPSHSILIRLLLHIYDGRPPEPFEVLWCDNLTMPHMVRAFLERAKHHPRRTFTLLQVDLIAHTVQHALLKLLLASRDVAAGQLRVGHNVRCVETGPCALQSASWIRLESAEEVCEHIDLATLLPRFAVGGCKASVTCFLGPAGSGKTHQLRKRALATSGAAHHCTLSITEAFSVGDAAKKLHEAALASVGKSIVLSVFINVGKFKHSERSQWSSLMERVNKLFFGLLVLGSVEDPLSDVVFNMPPGSQLQLLVEIPDRDAHLEPPPNETALSAAERNARDRRLLTEELPVIAAASTFVDAAAQALEIDERAKHVCKYLKAYDDTLNGRPGGIDQQYSAGAGGEKAVMFVLDSSGSMEGPRIDTCKRSLLNDIFGKRLSENDHVGFFAFDHAIRNEVSMDRWSGAHRSTLENTVRGIRATGGTDLWSAMNHACSRISTHPCQTKWIVALTDGESAGSPERTKQLLGSALFKGVRVLFVTVDISNQYLQIIKDAVVRAPGDAVISANGGTAALEQAWREVGEKLTVSQKIEKAGATITDAECTQLLHKFMRLDGTHREWTRLKQTHWITYLFRRCKILAASDKFNKNKEFAKFGSTTMKIMLEEVTACPQPCKPS
jgi:Mg-chelatase subunit ChlD